MTPHATHPDQMTLQVLSPMDGTVVPLSSVSHPVFSTSSLGAGVAIVPDPGVELVEITSPVAGTIVRMKPHQFLIDTGSVEASAGAVDTGAAEQGARILVNIGIDTDQLGGQGYSAHVIEGDTVRAGGKLVTYTPKELGRMGYDPIVVVVAMGHETAEIAQVAQTGVDCCQRDVLFRM